MQAEIVMIGTELLLGQIVDTNAAFMGKTLAEHGINLFQKTTVGDNRERILRVLDTALDRADVVLTSGGLGPTEDDITRDCIAELTGRPLEFRDDLFEELAARFASFKRPMTENNKRQAYAPKGATSIPNPNGTAPGLIVEDDRGIIMAMPGVPIELYAMLTDSVIPFLRNKFGLDGLLHYRVLKVCGLGESSVDNAIGEVINAYDNPKIGLLASPDAVRIRISARANDLDEANALIDEAEAKVRERLPGLIMGVDDDTLEGVVERLLDERGWTLALAESYTGGMMAQRLTAAGGACFMGGYVISLQHVIGSDLAVTAQEWACRTRDQHGASAGLSLFADIEKGQAVAALVTPEGDRTWEFGFTGLSERIQVRGTVTCLERVRRFLTGTEA
ncbi:MAG: CinA family nicotinamide mononucleotide deamidase-related protein [bacterium]|nr:CinA family nicotinamide mononucleotide deamidase-related protein [bacterium]